MTHTEKHIARTARSGFTLIELMMGIFIVGIITGGVAYTIMQVMANAKRSSTKTTLQVLKGAISSYEQEKGEYPKSLKELQASGILKGKLPNDGWGHPFVYTVSRAENAKHPYELYSKGPNPKEKASRIDAWTAK